ncbi:alpha/beta fold hydrolase [Pedobacter sp. HMF7647]|uniref:Alpha/beta fold hydrolase n=1 Tax=Hufsiella arboris TaxID=2695275 RepID=A0A7K1YCV4_9SPHI|nr:alpha/beta hydrolase [Hufsiella arboris]MXV52405.1 alpha/beta fold hydrolase [Hufsiella arboris]
MKTFITFLSVFILASVTASAQDISGRWSGILEVQNTKLTVVFNISAAENGYATTMDSPDQGVTGIPATSTVFENSRLKIAVKNAGIEYEAELKENKLTGIFRQGGLTLPLNLTKTETEKKALLRPQEPVKPYPYYTEDVSFPSEKGKITMAGTLSLPKKDGKFPVVILISGSGPQNRNEELMGHKPFLVISDYLTRNGIGVLRYDDRGVGQSTGNFQAATSADFAADAESAIAYLKTRKEADLNNIGLVGHSEGGLIAPMVAAKSRDVKFIVLLAGPGLRGDKVLLRQQEVIAKAAGTPQNAIDKSIQMNAKLFDMVVASKDDQKLKAGLTSYLKQSMPDVDSNSVATLVAQTTSPWMLYFLRYDPSLALAHVKCPVLALNGEKDMQVDADQNLSAIEQALKKAGNKDVTTVKISSLNHLFQKCETGAIAEYTRIEQTFYPAALGIMTDWIKRETK